MEVPSDGRSQVFNKKYMLNKKPCHIILFSPLKNTARIWRGGMRDCVESRRQSDRYIYENSRTFPMDYAFDQATGQKAGSWRLRPWFQRHNYCLRTDQNGFLFLSSAGLLVMVYFVLFRLAAGKRIPWVWGWKHFAKNMTACSRSRSKSFLAESMSWARRPLILAFRVKFWDRCSVSSNLW